MISNSSFQKLWFPGEKNNRSIFNFNNGVLNIESPGFPLVPEDKNNFGNVITLGNGVGYYIIGKYLVDDHFKVINDSNGIFDNISMEIPCTAFAPDYENPKSAFIYYIDYLGLHVGHIKRNLINESSLDSLVTVSLTHTPSSNTPLAILGDASGNGLWVFYISDDNDLQKLIAAHIVTGVEVNRSKFNLTNQSGPINIDISKSRIAILFKDKCLHYGMLYLSKESVSIEIAGEIENISPYCVQSAFSSTSNSLFWLEEKHSKNYLKRLNISSLAIESSLVNNCYKSLKCGPDNIIYGLSKSTNNQPTLLMATPNGLIEEFSVTEAIVPTEGGYFPANGWSVYHS